MGKLNIKGQNEKTLIPYTLNTHLEDQVIQIYDPRPGDPCPQCIDGHLDYDGLLNLVCQQCGYTLAGCST